MKLLDIQAAIGTAILLLSLPCDANHKHSHTHRQLEIFERRHSHSHNHQRLHASPRAENVESGLEKRGTCAFPTNAGLVAVTPDALNAGWAMAPDKPCRTGKYCPYACPPGQVMAQWNPEATSYVYPLSMVGSRLSLNLEAGANYRRMVDFIATITGRFQNRSPISHIVLMELELWERRTIVMELYHSVKLSCLEMRTC